MFDIYCLWVDGIEMSYGVETFINYPFRLTIILKLLPKFNYFQSSQIKPISREYSVKYSDGSFSQIYYLVFDEIYHTSYLIFLEGD